MSLAACSPMPEAVPSAGLPPPTPSPPAEACHIAVTEAGQITIQGRLVPREALKDRLAEHCSLPRARCRGEVVDGATLLIDGQPVAQDALHRELAWRATRCADLVLRPAPGGPNALLAEALALAESHGLKACAADDLRCVEGLKSPGAAQSGSAVP